MNIKRFTAAAIVAFIVMSVFEWTFHSGLMSNAYQATAELWRSEAEMQSKFPFLILGQFLFALVFTYIFTRNYEGKGIGEGIRYGFLIALLLSTLNFVWYAIAPYPTTMLLAWTGGEFVKDCLMGTAVAAIYRN